MSSREEALTTPNNQASTSDAAIVTALRSSGKVVSVALTRSVAATRRARGRLGSPHALSLDGLGGRVASRNRGSGVLGRGLLSTLNTHFVGE